MSVSTGLGWCDPDFNLRSIYPVVSFEVKRNPNCWSVLSESWPVHLSEAKLLPEVTRAECYNYQLLQSLMTHLLLALRLLSLFAISAIRNLNRYYHSTVFLGNILMSLFNVTYQNYVNQHNKIRWISRHTVDLHVLRVSPEFIIDNTRISFSYENVFSQCWHINILNQ